jgi:RND family efflux transporter MFP subunit
MSQPDTTSGRPVPRRLRLVGIAFVIVVVLIVAYGLVSRAAQDSRLSALTDEEAVPTVSIAIPEKTQNHAGLDLPGRLEAFIRAPIYARVPGYLKSWKYDIGAPVKAGAVLAEIDTPDLDQQLMQARADLNVSEANAHLAQISATRWQSLAGTDAVAKQDVDQRTYSLNANLAQVKASEANVDRLMAEQGFKRLVAPFDGIVTARETDIGALINVGASGGAELFVVSATSKLRIYINVPQNYVPSVPSGTKATLAVPEHPGKVYTGTVESSSQAVDPSTGTTLMQIIVDNTAGELMPGDYASIHLQVPGLANVLSVPASALIFNAKGLFVAVVDGNNHALVKPVTIARDLGQIVELASGLTPQDRVIANPPDGISTGDEVRLLPAGSAVATPKAP